MEKQHKDAVWVPHAEIEPRCAAGRKKRRILACKQKDAMGGKYLETGVWVPCTATRTRRSPTSSPAATALPSATRPARWAPATPAQAGRRDAAVCLEGGVMLDFFTPMREDFV